MAQLGDTNIVGDLSVTGKIYNYDENGEELPQIVAWGHFKINSERTTMNLMAGYNIKSIERIDGSNSYFVVTFINPIKDAYYSVTASGDISSVGVEYFSVYDQGTTKFAIDCGQLTSGSTVLKQLVPNVMNIIVVR